MDVYISVLTGDRMASLESLTDWLSGEPDLAGRFRMAGPAPQPGEMGVASDALVVAVSSGGALSILAGSLKAWLGQPRRSDIRVLVRGEGDREIEIDAKRVATEDVGRLLGRLVDDVDPR